MKAYSVGPDINGLMVAICSRLTAKRRPFFLQCKMSLLMWWTVPAPGNEVPLG
jgi:hypothetical protein